MAAQLLKALGCAFLAICCAVKCVFVEAAATTAKHDGVNAPPPEQIADAVNALGRESLLDVLEVSLVTTWTDGTTLDSFIQFANAAPGASAESPIDPGLDGDALLNQVFQRIGHLPDAVLAGWLLEFVPQDILTGAVFGPPEFGGPASSSSSPDDGVAELLGRFFDAEVSAKDIWETLEQASSPSTSAAVSLPRASAPDSLDHSSSNAPTDLLLDVDATNEAEVAALKGAALFARAQLLLFRAKAVSGLTAAYASVPAITDFELALTLLVDAAQYYDHADSLALLVLLHFSKAHSFLWGNAAAPGGLMVATRLGIRNPLKALQKASKNGSAIAARALGHYYLHGINGVKRSCAKAAQHFFPPANEHMNLVSTGAASNLAEAQVLVREIWKDQDYMVQVQDMYDPAFIENHILHSALDPFSEFADPAESHFLMGESHMQGATPGSVPNMTAAMEEYQLAADSGHAEAMARMGVLKLQGFDGHPPDAEAGVPLLTAAADLGSPSAYNALGYLYLQGEGVPANDTKAFEMFLKASDAVGEYYGEDGAELDSESVAPGGFFNEVKINLAVMYLEGRGTPRNVTKARLIFEEAANFGYINAAFNIGLLQFQGPQGAGQDIPQDLCAAAGRFEVVVDSALQNHGLFIADPMTTVRAVLKAEDDLSSALSAYSIMAAAGNPGAALNAAFLLKQFGSSPMALSAGGPTTPIAQSPHTDQGAGVDEEVTFAGEGSLVSSSGHFDRTMVNEAGTLTQRLLDSAAAALRDHMGTTRDLFRNTATVGDNSIAVAAGRGSDDNIQSNDLGRTEAESANAPASYSTMWNTTLMSRPIHAAKDYLLDIIHVSESGLSMGLGVTKAADSDSEATVSNDGDAARTSHDVVKADHKNTENDEDAVVDSILPSKASPFFSFTDFIKDAKQQLGYCHLDGWGGACSVDKQQALEYFEAASELWDAESAFAAARTMRDLGRPFSEIDSALDRCEQLDPYCLFPAVVLQVEMSWQRLKTAVMDGLGLSPSTAVPHTDL